MKIDGAISYENIIFWSLTRRNATVEICEDAG